MTEKELAARMLLVVRSSQEKALRNRFTGRRDPSIPSAAAVGSPGPSPESMLEQALTELSEKDRTNLEGIVDTLLETLKR
jgi:hypothetical protein